MSPRGRGWEEQHAERIKGKSSLQLCAGNRQLVSGLFGLTSLETFTGGLLIDKEHTDYPTRSWEFCNQGFWCRICPIGTSPIVPQMCCCLGGEIMAGFSFLEGL